MRYTPIAVRGSEALDLERLAYEETFEPEVQPLLSETTGPRHGSASQTHSAERVRTSPLVVLGVMVLISLCVLLLLGNIRLTAVSAASVSMEQELEKLEQENDVLKIRYENTFHLKEIETYATKTLGMSRLTDDQITVLPTEGENRAEILRTGDVEAAGSVLREAGGLAQGIRAFFSR